MLLQQRGRKDIYWFAIPNAGRRSLRMGAWMKAEGLQAGIADLCVMFPGGTVAWLELKTAKGMQTDAQKGFEAICRRLDHRYRLVRSFEQAMIALKEFGALVT